MKTKNFFLGGIVGGIVYFLLGYLFYGVLLKQYFADHPGTVTGIDRTMEQFQWWALGLGNLLLGFLLAYVFSKSGISSMSSGLVTGAVIGFLMHSSYDLIMYSTTNAMSKHALMAGVGTFTVMSAITGAIVAAVMGMGKKTTG